MFYLVFSSHLGRHDLGINEDFHLLGSQPSARRSPTKNAPYSAWLFEVGKDNARENSIKVRSLFSNMMPTSLPVKLKAPSTKIVHRHALFECVGKVISTTKLADT